MLFRNFSYVLTNKHQPDVFQSDFPSFILLPNIITKPSLRMDRLPQFLTEINLTFFGAHSEW